MLTPCPLLHYESFSKVTLYMARLLGHSLPLPLSFPFSISRGFRWRPTMNFVFIGFSTRRFLILSNESCSANAEHSMNLIFLFYSELCLASLSIERIVACIRVKENCELHLSCETFANGRPRHRFEISLSARDTRRKFAFENP